MTELSIDKRREIQLLYFKEEIRSRNGIPDFMEDMKE
jgi:hypothetical protein